MPATRTSPGRAAGIALLLAIAALSGACKQGRAPAAAAGKSRRNLLLITLDTTRADRIGAYGDSRAATPNLDRLAREGVRFDRAYSSAPLTLPAHVTLMTGREPPAHRVRNNGTYVLGQDETTLAEAFHQAGFSTMAMIAAFVLQGKFGLSQGFDGYDDSLGIQQLGANFLSELPAGRMLEKFQRWLARRPQSPFFCWVHLYDPHAPYQPPPSFRDRFPDDPYRGEIAFMDEAIGRMLRDLDQQGLLQETLVVIAGDHGEGFGEHDEKEHGVFCYEETLRVPLIFHHPHLISGGRVVSQPVGLVDVLPTLLELFQLPVSPGVSGKSLVHLLEGGGDDPPTATPRYFESMYGFEELGFAPLTGLLSDRYKFISLPTPELYDLAADPLEKNNLFLKKSMLARQLARQLDERLGQLTRSAGKQVQIRPSSQDQARLAALGYLAGDGVVPREGQGQDPKQGIAVLNQLIEAKDAVRRKDFAGASRLLKELRSAGADRQLPHFFDISYELALAQNDRQTGEKALRDATARFPAASRFPMQLAMSQLNQGREAQAEKILRGIVARDPLITQAHLLLGRISRDRRDSRTAIAHWQQANRLEPGNAKVAVELAELLVENSQPDPAFGVLRPFLDTKALQGEPGGEELGRQAAWLLKKMGKPEMAAQLLSGLLQDKNDDPANWTQLGLAQLDLGQMERAEGSFQQALRFAPGNALALSSLGTIQLTRFQKQKDRESLRQAGDFFSRALAADAKLITAINGLGVVNLYLGDIPGAIAQLRSAIRIDPGFVNAHFNLAIAQLSIGRKAAARQTLSRLQAKLADRLSQAEREQLAALLREAGS